MKENKLNFFLGSRVVIFLLLLAFIWLSLVLVKAVYKKYQLDQEISSLKSEIEKTDKKNQELNQLLDYFNSQAFLEKEAKDKLNLKKEGENVVLVQDAVGEQSETSVEDVNGVSEKTAQPTALVKKNNLVKWWEFFFKR